MWESLLDVIFGKSQAEQKIRALTKEDCIRAMSPVTLDDGSVSLFRYDDSLIREMVWALKYRRNRHVAELFATALSRYLETEYLTTYIVTPIPLSPKRQAKRGFNQLDLVIACLPKDTANTHLLVKTRETAPQTSLTRAERVQNLKGAFAVRDQSLVRNKNIVLIDDVTTTGTTLTEATRTLRASGAKSVRTIALAR